MGAPDAPPMPPLNLVGDFGGGSMLAALGILAALFERTSSGKGQVVDASIVDGAASLMSFFSGLFARGRISVERDANVLGGAAPFYRCYRCKDGKYIAVGALEPQFYAELVKRISGPDEQPGILETGRADPANWPEQAETFAAIFAAKTRDEWCALLEGTDACFAPVLRLEETVDHPHIRERGVYRRDANGALHVTPVPRFSRTPGAARPSMPIADMDEPWK